MEVLAVLGLLTVFLGFCQAEPMKDMSKFPVLVVGCSHSGDLLEDLLGQLISFLVLIQDTEASLLYWQEPHLCNG